MIQGTLSVPPTLLEDEYQSVRRRLLRDEKSDCLSASLCRWAQPGDRCLPGALLQQPLAVLLSTPYSELAATRGVGVHKLSSLVMLLRRAAGLNGDQHPGHGLAKRASMPRSRRNVSRGETSPRPSYSLGEHVVNSPALAASQVCEATWDMWRGAITSAGLSNEPLGRYVPRLSDLARVVWHTPLGLYAAHPLAEIRGWKTYGAKRVSQVVESFGIIVRLLEIRQAPARDQAVVRIMPSELAQAETWLVARTAQAGARGNGRTAPGLDEIEKKFVGRLLNQVTIDAGPLVAELVAQQVLENQQPHGVRLAAARLGVTRARIYQRLADSQEMMRLRWPRGISLTRAWLAVAAAGRADESVQRLGDSVLRAVFGHDSADDDLPEAAAWCEAELPAQAARER